MSASDPSSYDGSTIWPEDRAPVFRPRLVVERLRDVVALEPLRLPAERFAVDRFAVDRLLVIGVTTRAQ